jgi:hypothetical protein
VLKGLLTGGITLGIAAVFPPPLVLSFFAVVMGLTVGVGPGLAMGNPEEGRPGVEWVAALFFVALGLLGLWFSPLVLATALALHGLWSLLRQFTALGDGQLESYGRFCVAFDLVLAGFVAYIWAVGV